VKASSPVCQARRIRRNSKHMGDHLCG